MAKNIVLIGMMGCGKTTVGRLLSRRLGLELGGQLHPGYLRP